MSDAFWAALFGALLGAATLVKQVLAERRAEARAVDAAKASTATDKAIAANTALTTDIKKQTDGITDKLVATAERAAGAEGELQGAKDEHAKQHRTPTRPHTTRSRKSDKARKRKATP